MIANLGGEAMALAMRTSGDGEWETVKSRRGDRKKNVQAIPEARPKVSKSAPAEPVRTTANNTFDALFEKEAPARGERKKGMSVGSDVLTPGTPPQAEEQNPTAFTAKGEKKDANEGKENKDKKNKKKPRKKSGKTGQASNGTSSGLAGISSVDLKLVLEDAAKQSPSNEAAQLECIANRLLQAFKDASVGFPSEVRHRPLQETVELVDGFLSGAASKDLADFLQKKSVGSLSTALCIYLRALFDASEGVAGCKDQAGLVILVSMIARTNPVAVVRCLEELVYDGARFTSSDRLPLLLWVFEQAERGACGAYLACWMRILLPQLLGSPLQNPALLKGKSKKKARPQYHLDSKSSQQAALVLDRGLNGGSKTFAISPTVQAAGNTGLQYMEGGCEMTEPIVSLRTLDQILILIHTSRSVPQKIVKAIAALASTFRCFAYSSAGPPSLQSFVPLTLAFAARSDGGYLGPGDKVVAEAARNLISCLQEDPECFEVWAVSHKKEIKGSCRILQHLLHEQPREFLDMLRNPTKRAAFLATMQKLQERHGFLLAQDNGWQAACAKGAHEATKKFLDGGVIAPKSSLGVSTPLLFASCILVSVGSAVVASKWDEIGEMISSAKDTAAWERVVEVANSEMVQTFLSSFHTAVNGLMETYKGAKEKFASVIN